VDLVSPMPESSLLAVDQALVRLQAIDPLLARVAEMRLFAGLEHADIALALGVSTRTIERAWKAARAWLQRELEAE
jgi:DNA-directed RNA polymerase specialized sigma24 family protein